MDRSYQMPPNTTEAPTLTDVFKAMDLDLIPQPYAVTAANMRPVDPPARAVIVAQEGQKGTASYRVFYSEPSHRRYIRNKDFRTWAYVATVGIAVWGGWNVSDLAELLGSYPNANSESP